MSRFSIEIEDNQSTAVSRGEFKDRVEHLRFSTSLPGGCFECEFKIYAAINYAPDYLGINYKLFVRDGGTVFWVGRMEDFVAHRGSDGEYWTVKSLGYGVNGNDQKYTTRDVSNQQTSVIVSDVRTNLMPQVTQASITATGYTLSNATAITLKLLSGHEVINWAALFGDSSDNPQIWYVYPDDNGDARLTYKPRPTFADALMRSRDADLIEYGLLTRRLFNKTTVQYNAGAATASENDTTLQGAGPAGWNFTREGRLFLPEITQSADATQAAQVAMTTLKNARLGARTIQLKPSAALLGSPKAGQYWESLPLHRVRAGMLVQITDLIPRKSPLTNLDFLNSFLIVGTSYDEDSQVLTITPESYDYHLSMIVARAGNLLEGRHTF